MRKIGTGSLVVKAPYWNTRGPGFNPQPVHLFHYHSRSILEKELILIYPYNVGTTGNTEIYSGLHVSQLPKEVQVDYTIAMYL